jgi:hypothetical protein
MNRSRAVLVAGALFVAFSAQGACDDVSPLPYAAPVPEGGFPDRADPEQVAACRQCTHADAVCVATYESCKAADARCPVLFDCMQEKDCWRLLTDLTNPPPCGTACLKLAKLGGINEIAAAATNYYFNCLLDSKVCAGACIAQPNASGASTEAGDGSGEE